ncbi:MAG: hypothetical protein QMD50_01480 [Patescibacteria group bacterium]|nr:hypothetical protein [Patescibacteria group bacterium]
MSRYYKKRYGYRRRYYGYNKRRRYNDTPFEELLDLIFTGLGWLIYHTIRGLIYLAKRAWKLIGAKKGIDGDSKIYVFEPVEEFGAKETVATISEPTIENKRPPEHELSAEKPRYYKKQSLLTAAEDNFYQVLDKIAKENDYII